VSVLVIGGTGLISSAIVPLLLERGEDVTVLTRGSSARAVPAGVTHVSGDRRDAGFGTLVRSLPVFDCVVDMICYEPAEAETAVAAFAGRTGQYLLTSTIDVYRKPAVRYPYREDEPYGGVGEYAVNKVACERIFSRAAEDGALPLTILRPGATYGPLHPPVHSLGRSTTYLDRLRKGKPIVVHGDGSSFWVSCHADDVAVAFAGAIGNDAAIGRSFHATGEEWVTWDEHHRALARAIGAPEPRIVHIPTDDLVLLAGERAALTRDNFRFNNIFDNSAAREVLGFRYRIGLEEGFAGWYRSLEEAGMIEDSERDDFEDRLIRRWDEARRQLGRGESNLS
jgi:nucleoside-diphosphate-sugar epimerase